MDDPKYILFDHPLAGETVIVFPCYVEHHLVAQLLGWEPLSAGFFTVSGNKVTTSGYSESTKLRPGLNDHYFIEKALNLPKE